MTAPAERAAPHATIAAGTGYRPDIDGLRAVAVLVVVLYHVDFARIRSGFIGVDVFFVISGYLITQILASELAIGQYSVLRFYDRRIRRIFPALFLVLLCTFAAALIFLLPTELIDFAHSLESTILFASNMYYLFASDYFNPASQISPLIHTWSLAVEEQFYIVFPLFLYAIRKLSNRRKWTACLIVAVVSLALAVLLVRSDQGPRAFYLMPARAWELLIGAMLALPFLPRLRSPLLREAVAAAGLALILLSTLVWLTGNRRFPGLGAIAPCLGAACIIHAGQTGQTWTARLLSTKPMVFTGLISYSLYLWHWPIIVFARLYQISPFTLGEKFGLILASYIAAVLSWRYVERPFRRRTILTQARGLRLAATGSMAAFLVGAALLANTAQSMPWFPPDVVQLSRYLHYDTAASYRVGRCFLTLAADVDRYDWTRCATPSPDRPNIFLVGDSHAAHLWSGLSNAWPGINFLQATAAGCKPVEHTTGGAACADLINEVLLDRIARMHLAGVMLSAQWSEADIPRVVATVDALAPHVGTVYVSGPIVEYYQSLPRVIAQAQIRHAPELLIAARRPEQVSIDAQLRAALAGHSAVYLSPYKILCPDPDAACTTADPLGIPLQFDYGHLTAEGSSYVAQRMLVFGNPP